ncbi:molybdenum cofactor guanylyltransferase [Bacillus sp. MUM 13]|uniref:molybdenum cofactor guanylyltransferase n=1 Tax=Bacillus sp. MUM 13 TaxID=1678001 RepID=UPI0008F5D127|nr:molybdenum cofactor guanylyltransferase [Bacillus sp. MUM 13]OIK12512.1 hypothetical protein BIV59_08420 [Bacillus sp. MUM 13]
MKDTEKRKSETTAILLAGGKSSRMGVNKALLSMSHGVNIAAIAGELEKEAGGALLITNTPESYKFLGLPMIADRYKDSGPLGGIHAGLCASKTDINLIAACDMPFIKAEAAREIVMHIGEYDAAVPEIHGQMHPLFAVYRKSCLPVLQACLDEGQLRVRQFLNGVRVKVLKETDFKLFHQQPEFFPHIFYNMNDREEYEKAKKMEREYRHFLN